MNIVKKGYLKKTLKELSSLYVELYNKIYSCDVPISLEEHKSLKCELDDVKQKLVVCTLLNLGYHHEFVGDIGSKYSK